MPWATTPDDTTTYQIDWQVFNDTTAFVVEQADVDGGGALTSDWVRLGIVQGVQGTFDGPLMPATWAVRFTPISSFGVEYRTARWVITVDFVGDQTVPAAPTDSTSGEGA